MKLRLLAHTDVAVARKLVHGAGACTAVHTDVAVAAERLGPGALDQSTLRRDVVVTFETASARTLVRSDVTPVVLSACDVFCCV